MNFLCNWGKDFLLKLLYPFIQPSYVVSVHSFVPNSELNPRHSSQQWLKNIPMRWLTQRTRPPRMGSEGNGQKRIINVRHMRWECTHFKRKCGLRAPTMVCSRSALSHLHLPHYVHSLQIQIFYESLIKTIPFAFPNHVIRDKSSEIMYLPVKPYNFSYFILSFAFLLHFSFFHLFFLFFIYFPQTISTIFYKLLLLLLIIIILWITYLPIFNSLWFACPYSTPPQNHPKPPSHPLGCYCWKIHFEE